MHSKHLSRGSFSVAILLTLAMMGCVKSPIESPETKPSFGLQLTGPDSVETYDIVGFQLKRSDSLSFSSYLWDFGDGSAPYRSYNLTQWHRFEAEGNFRLTVIRADQSGNQTDSTSLLITVRNNSELLLTQNPLDSDLAVYRFSFVGAAPKGAKFNWHFTDISGEVKTDTQTVVHRFRFAGSHAVTLSIFDSTGVYLRTLKRVLEIPASAYEHIFQISIQQYDAPTYTQYALRVSTVPAAKPWEKFVWSIDHDALIFTGSEIGTGMPFSGEHSVNVLLVDQATGVKIASKEISRNMKGNPNYYIRDFYYARLVIDNLPDTACSTRWEFDDLVRWNDDASPQYGVHAIMDTTGTLRNYTNDVFEVLVPKAPTKIFSDSLRYEWKGPEIKNIRFTGRKGTCRLNLDNIKISENSPRISLTFHP